MKRNTKTLIVILGPTASGKTDLAIRMALHFHSEIISADSRQFYLEIPIGTAAPDQEQLAKIPHHFVGHLKTEQEYNVSRFENDVISLLKDRFETLDTMVLVGGSGLYIDAVCQGIDKLPDPDPKLRNMLESIFQNEGLSALRNQLAELDPVYFEKVDKNNSKRLIRAIEVCMQTGKTYTELRLNTAVKRNFSIIKIGLDVPRQVLNLRINNRVDEMIANGWIEEARQVYPFRNRNALNTVGFKELFNYFDGIWNLETAIEKIKTNTRRYAKRQMTWFKKDGDIKWFAPEQITEILAYIESNSKQ